MNLPDGFGYVLLVLALVLTLAPWFHGMDFGVVKIPDFPATTRRTLVALGPLALILAIALHVPISRRDAAPDQRDTARDPLAAAPTVGDALAEWQGSGCLYPARVLGRDGDDAVVRFDHDPSRDVTMPATSVLRRETAGPAVGATGYVQLPKRDAWVPATVRDVEDGQLYVQADTDSACAAEFGKALQWVAPDRFIPSHSTGDMP